MSSSSPASPLMSDGGDLGLGRGWKPGALPKEFNSDEDSDAAELDLSKSSSEGTSASKYPQIVCNNDFNKQNDMPPTSQNYHDRVSLNRELDLSASSSSLDGEITDTQMLARLRVSPIPSNRSETNLSVSSNEISTNNSSTCVDETTSTKVPIGTSFRQQRQLFDNNIQELFPPQQTDEVGQRQSIKKTKKTKYAKKQRDPSTISSVPTLQKKLSEADMEIDLLKLDLDQCQQQLQSKHKAIAILKKQAVLSNSEVQKSTLKANQATNKYQQEINKLQFELDYKQTSLLNSQQTWSERFDRLSRENLDLGSNLEEKAVETKKLMTEKMALVRERDELLALLDVHERERYEALRPRSENQPYGDLSSSELAILGACQCRKQDPEPCGCSYAAANLKREVMHLKGQIDENKQRHQVSMTTVDAYRQAFDEQLNRNKCLVRQLAGLTATITSNNNKAAKFKAAMKWLLQQLNEDLPPHGHQETALTEQMVEEKTEQELVVMLVEMVSDKNEALAHQRLAARILADRAKELEDKLAVYTQPIS